MGRWHTIHLFDERKFQGLVVPKMRGELGGIRKDLREISPVLRYMGSDKYTDEEKNVQFEKQVMKIESFSRKFNKEFTTHCELMAKPTFENRRKLMKELEFSWEFVKLAQNMIFKYCSDYSPYLIAGKHGIETKFQADESSIGLEVIDLLSEYHNEELNLFSDDGGILGWILHENLSLMYFDKEKLKLKNDSAQEEFDKIIEVAYENGLGLISTVEMGNFYDTMPKNKLLPPDALDGRNDAEFYVKII